jgi:hypothetical protein
LILSTGGQAKTLMFVHISPESDAVGETISTLKFAERVSTVELGAARLNKESGEVRELKEQVCFCCYVALSSFILFLLYSRYLCSLFILRLLDLNQL